MAVAPNERIPSRSSRESASLASETRDVPRTAWRISLLAGGLLLAAVALAPSAHAQPDSSGPPDPQAEVGSNEADSSLVDGESIERVSIEAKATALRSLSEAISARTKELDALETALRESPSREERSDLLPRIRGVREEIARLERQVDEVAGEIDLSLFEEEIRKPFDLQSEIIQLLEPLVAGLKSATEAPRAISQLRRERNRFHELALKAGDAAARAEAAIAHSPEAARAILERSIEAWRQRKHDLERQRDVLTAELANRERSRRPVFDVVQDELSRFFSTRGLHLLLGAASFLGIFLALRFIHRRAFIPLYKKRARSFPLRVVNVFFHLVTVFASIAALLVAFFAVNDWPLLVLVLLFLAGVGWVSIRGIPRFFEQIRLLLNIGAVRENERIIYEGLPWRVDALMLHSKLSNPLLTGGRLRVPIRDLIGRQSRPMDPLEPWFPCREGDWVRLRDGRRGRVVRQTPESVELCPPGGGLITYRTLDFLAENPQNLSKGFRIDIVFRIDHCHREAATTKIPQKMREYLVRRIPMFVPEEMLVDVRVELREAGPSSLDYEIEIDLGGGAAPHYEQVERGAIGILLDAANENGWKIPFHQIALHQAP